MNRRSLLTLLSATAAGTALAACSTGAANEETAESPQSAGGSGGSKPGPFPVTVKHALGETTIEQAPTRIATLGWADQDTVLALGVVPIGAPKITWGGNKNESTDFFDAEVKRMGGKEPVRYSDADGAPVDEIAKLRPDLIIATVSGVTKAEYAKLSKIAPVVAYPGEAWGTSWQESLQLIGRALGRADKAKSLRSATEKVIKDGVAKYPELKGKTSAWITFLPTDLSKFSVYTPQDARTRMMDAFGLAASPAVSKLTKGSKKFFVDMSAEKSSTLDADVVVFYVDSAEQEKQTVKHPLLGKIPALKAGSYVASKDKVASLPMSSPTPLSIPIAVQDFLPELAAAAKKVTS